MVDTRFASYSLLPSYHTPPVNASGGLRCDRQYSATVGACDQLPSVIIVGAVTLTPLNDLMCPVLSSASTAFLMAAGARLSLPTEAVMALTLIPDYQYNIPSIRGS